MVWFCQILVSLQLSLNQRWTLASWSQVDLDTLRDFFSLSDSSNNSCFTAGKVVWDCHLARKYYRSSIFTSLIYVSSSHNKTSNQRASGYLRRRRTEWWCRRSRSRQTRRRRVRRWSSCRRRVRRTWTGPTRRRQQPWTLTQIHDLERKHNWINDRLFIPSMQS
jgi:hypothetical protein